ncbi:sensor histidine kinase [Flavisolibacter ginsengisoli]|jgi:signal transduction histidine kinase|uniref:histidine kinase n=1 Tax=Flavisolibacter ginsengisoli DSM 18119 TaxID=1121884 RepID=A0A1M4U285_9BACT|nr:HAMP domain-containing sensor histidine kinase [Flavisolibacter ginsengisoli]SHE50805.1 Histidine kinase-, DNA gyrase B-, and HSP90-like ATPase [Flavisolibacter ginsengisoli DSM 18119]
MFRQLINWRTLLAIIAILIVSGTISYSSYLGKKIEKEERQKVEEWVEASTSLLNPNNTGDTRLHLKIIQDNNDIPIIWTNEKDSIFEFINLDSTKIHEDKNYLNNMLQKFKSQVTPITWIDPLDSSRINKYYYGHSRLLDEVRYYPLVQLLIVGLFILITVGAIRSSYRSTQNQVWAGMAKETAHQLGTPVSSLEGWVEILKETHGHESFVPEIEKDVSRLRLVSDRFGKIGSTPQLELLDIIEQVENMVEYIRKRAGGRVSFSINTNGAESIPVHISAPLFDWVIENLLKNGLDAMEGKGSIIVDIKEQPDSVFIDITDSGKGISKQNIQRIFKPGFTTKKRGWGLGLSLSKRIVEQYHKGSLTVKNSEIGKGTTFRIVLVK